MAAYKSARIFKEGNLSVTDMLVVSDTYAGLFDIASATEVNVLLIAETSEELKDGASVVNAAKFTANEAAILTTADRNCVDFLLTVLSGGVVYLARFINPETPATESDFCFLGRVDRRVTGKDTKHSETDLFSSTTEATRVYSFTCSSFDSGAMFGKKISDLVRDSEDVSTISPAWKTANVADRLAYFKTDGSDGYGQREVRFANLVSLKAVIEYLFSAATEAGVTGTYAGGDSNLHGTPCFYLPLLKHSGSTTYLRYCSDGAAMTVAPKPFHLIGGQSVRLKTGGETAGSPYVSLRLIDPNENEKAVSWLDLTVFELLSKIALSYGCVLTVNYTGTNTIEAGMVPTEEFSQASFLIKDFASSDIDISLSIAEESEKNKGLKGVAYLLANEGTQYYLVEDQPKQTYAAFEPKLEPPFLPLTISPTWAMLLGRGEDAGVDVVGKIGRALLPHNAVFYDGVSPKGSAYEYNLTAIHTAIYLKTAGLSHASSGEVGVEGLDTWRPIGQVSVKMNNQYRYFNTLEEFVSERVLAVASFREQSRKITVMGLNGFKVNAAASEDWRSAKVGYLVTLDSKDYICTKIVRKEFETELELRLKEEFSKIEEPDSIEDNQPNAFPIATSDGMRRKPFISALPSGSNSLYKGEVLGIDSDGKASRLIPNASGYGKQVGICLEDWAIETGNPYKMIDIQTSGIFDLGEDALVNFPFTAGSTLYLVDSVPNISDTPVADASGNWHFAIGRLSADGTSIEINMTDGGFIYE